MTEPPTEPFQLTPIYDQLRREQEQQPCPPEDATAPGADPDWPAPQPPS